MIIDKNTQFCVYRLSSLVLEWKIEMERNHLLFRKHIHQRKVRKINIRLLNLQLIIFERCFNIRKDR
jgi:hypothetical protein